MRTVLLFLLILYFCLSKEIDFNPYDILRLNTEGGEDCRAVCNVKQSYLAGLCTATSSFGASVACTVAGLASGGFICAAIQGLGWAANAYCGSGSLSRLCEKCRDGVSFATLLDAAVINQGETLKLIEFDRRNRELEKDLFEKLSKRLDDILDDLLLESRLRSVKNVFHQVLWNFSKLNLSDPILCRDFAESTLEKGTVLTAFYRLHEVIKSSPEKFCSENKIMNHEFMQLRFIQAIMISLEIQEKRETEEDLMRQIKNMRQKERSLIDEACNRPETSTTTSTKMTTITATTSTTTASIVDGPREGLLDSIFGRFKRNYGDALKETDDAIGEILEAVRRYSNNTLVVFTSDNGADLVGKVHSGSNGPLLCGKQTTFDGGFRTPTIAWWPNKIKAGSVSHKVATQMDLFKTFVELAGAKIPEDRIYDSYSLIATLLGEPDESSNPVFFYRGNLLMAVRVGGYKMHIWTWTNSEEELAKDIDMCPNMCIDGVTTKVHTNHTDNPVLFNLENDPGERYPINPESDEYSQIVPKLKKVVEDHRSRLVPGIPQLDWCDIAVMNWAPPGCDELDDCQKGPASKPFKCDWPH